MLIDLHLIPIWEEADLGLPQERRQVLERLADHAREPGGAWAQ